MNKFFVVKFSRDFWYTRRDAQGFVLGTPALGLAHAMSWPTALSVAQMLRDEGYWDAVACNYNGYPVITPTSPNQRVLDELRDSWLPS